jgi:hypothetical protein
VRHAARIFWKGMDTMTRKNTRCMMNSRMLWPKRQRKRLKSM